MAPARQWGTALLALCLAGCSAATEQSAGLQVYGLRAEGLRDPIGLDATAPRLSWRLRWSEPQSSPVAWQIRVASDPASLPEAADLWDSGRTERPGSGTIYGGRVLPAGTRVHWVVRVWDQNGSSAWSAPAHFEIGLRAADWSAPWIADSRPEPQRPEDFFDRRPATILRREFSLEEVPASARLYVCGLGLQHTTLNGQRISDAQLDPAWTDVRKRALYSTVDVGALLRKGANCIAVTLGHGRRSPLPMHFWSNHNLREKLPVGLPALRLELHVGTGSSREIVLATDTDWRASEGACRADDLYLGELRDLAREPSGWRLPGFDDRGWRPVQEASVRGAMAAQAIPPIRVQEEIPPRGQQDRDENRSILDFGFNMAAKIRLRARGPAGSRISLRYGELLHPTGELNTGTSLAGNIRAEVDGGPGTPEETEQRDDFLLAGDPEGELVETEFTYHAFRYAELTLDEGVEILELRALRLQTDLEVVGQFRCSDPDLNAIHQMVRNTFDANLLGVQTDCPGREKFQYGGDIVTSGEAVARNYDVDAFYRKVLQDFTDAQLEPGVIPITAPDSGIRLASGEDGSAPIDWSLVHPFVIDLHYRLYGDRRFLEEQYPVARAWYEHEQGRAERGELTALGDWCSALGTEPELSARLTLIWGARLMARLARLRGEGPDAARFEQDYRRMAQEIRDELYQPESGRFASANQYAQAMALQLGILEPEQEQAAVDRLVRHTLDEVFDGRLAAGIFGTDAMFRTLSSRGHAELLLDLVLKPGLGGYKHMLDSGATTLWEFWRSPGRGISHNHPMFGSVDHWLYAAVAGIEVDPDAIGADRMVFAPRLTERLEWARASYQSARGTNQVSWERSGDAVTLETLTPPGVAATVVLPAAEGRVLERPRAAERLPCGADELRLAVPPGRHRFRWQLP